MELRVMIEPQEGSTHEEQLGVARATEESGLEGLFRSDHYLKVRGGPIGPLPGPTDAWVTLAGLARETRRIRLGSMVTSATFRLPGPLAVMVAEVDAMSGGRVELGMGARAQVRAVYEGLEAACAAIGRDPASLVRSVALTCVLGQSEVECRRRAAAIGEDVAALRESSAAGTPEEVAEQLASFAELGATRAYLQVLDLSDLDQVRLAGAVLAPLVAGC